MVLIAVSIGLLAPRAAHAQIGQKTACLSTPIQIGGPGEALLDTLTHALERREGATVRRHPDQSERMSVSALRNTLIDTYGVGIVTANTLFVDYRFTVGASGQLELDVTGLHFLLQPGPILKEIPLLYVDAQ